MNGSPGTDRLIAWLDDEMSVRAPTHLLSGVLDGVAETSRRPSWRIPERWVPMRIAFALAVIPRAALLLLTMLLLTMILAATFVLAAQPVETPSLVGSVPSGLIAYDSGGDIWVADSDGSSSRRLVDGDYDLASPTWSNDGTRLAYYEYAPDGKHVHVISAAGTGDTDLTGDPGIEPLEVGNGGLRWSPDDGSIALSIEDDGRRAIVLLPTDGSGPVTLALPIEAGFPTWSPDGLLAFQGFDRADQAGTLGIYVVGADATGLRSLWRPEDMTTVPEFLLEPDWSPDGSSIAVSDLARIVVIDVASGRGRAITPWNESDYWPTWSHDGAKLAFQRSDGHPNYSVVVVRADGTDPTVLSLPPTGAAGFLDWSSDDSAILSQSPAWDALQLGHLDGSDAETIPVDGGLGSPSWQVDRRRLTGEPA